MPLVVGVRFKDSGKIYHFDPNGHRLNIGDAVVVETVRGLELGKIAVPIEEVPPSELYAELKPVVRQPSYEDYDRIKQLEGRNDEVMQICTERITSHRLPMRLVKGEWSFDGTRLTVYFTSQQRVDFRHLVRELARIFHARIELRQVGARDEAKLLGGIGPCGRPLCCSTFLPDFARVSVKMAKDQDLPLNPTKISGVCGRLLCCLSYEQEQYQAIRDELPRRGDHVLTPVGPGVVVAVNTIRETVTVDVEGNYMDFNAAQLAAGASGISEIARERVHKGEAAPIANARGSQRRSSGEPRPRFGAASQDKIGLPYKDLGLEEGDERLLAALSDTESSASRSSSPAKERPPQRPAPRHGERTGRSPGERQAAAPQQERAPNPQRPARGERSQPAQRRVRHGEDRSKPADSFQRTKLPEVPELLTPRNRQSPDPDEPKTGQRRRRRGNRNPALDHKPAQETRHPEPKAPPAAPQRQPQRDQQRDQQREQRPPGAAEQGGAQTTSQRNRRRRRRSGENKPPQSE